MKKYFLFLILSVFWYTANTQTATIQTVSNVTPGSNTTVNISLSGFVPDDIAGFQFTIRYDTTHLKYISTTNWFSGVSGVTVMSSVYYGSIHTLTFAWAESFGLAIDGILCKLNFLNKTSATGCQSIYWSDSPTTRMFIDGDYNEYTVTYVNGAICSVCNAVSISGQPSGQTINTGGSASFSVTAGGNTPLTYQWQYFNGTTWNNVVNGTPAGAVYTNATTGTLTVSGITAAGTYQYHCYVTNCNGANNSTSDAATLTVNTQCLPTATIQTVSGAIPGSNVAVNVLLSCFSPDISGFQFTIRYDTTHLKYISTTDWFSGVSGVTVVSSVYYGSIHTLTYAWAESFGLAIDGILCKLNFLNKTSATGCQSIYWSDSPTTRMFIDGDYNEYTVTYVNGAICSVCNAVSISGQPSGQTINTGGSASFSVTAGGDAPHTYQWQYYNGITWNNVVNGTPASAVYTNAATSTMTVSGITAAGTYQYHCYVTNCSGANNSTSDAATLTVNTQCLPTATIQTVSGAMPGSNVAVNVSLSCFTPDEISGFQFTVRYDTTNIRFLNASDWYPGVSGVTLLSSAYYGDTNALTFAWAESFSLVIDGVLCKLNFLNKTTASACASIFWSDFPTPRMFYDGDYNEYVVTYVDGALCSVCSPVSVTGHPSDKHIVNGGTANFTVTPVGSAPFTYQWQYYNGTVWSSVSNSIPAGAIYNNATTNILTVSGITGAGSYQYRCFLTNCSGADSVLSNTATLTVDTLCMPTATIQTITGVAPGSNVTTEIMLSCFAPDDISGFQFTIQYDTTDLGFISATDWYPGVSGVTVMSSDYYGDIHAITFAWAESFALPVDGLLCKLNFINKTNATGCDSIVWSDFPTPRMIIDGDYNEYSVTWVNGAVCTYCTPVSITGQPSDEQIYPGESADFIVAVSGSAPYNYQWQYYNGYGWLNAANGIPAGATYYNELTDTMTVSGLYILGDYLYRCIISNCDGANQTTTNISTLIVDTINGPTATIQTVPGVIPGSSVTVNIPLSYFAPDKISGFQFTIQYDTTNLKYTGASNWYTGINDVTEASVSLGSLKALSFLWGDLPVSIPNGGILCKLNFIYKATATGCESIYWSDTPTPRLFSDSNYNEFTVSYIAGAICPCIPVSINTAGQPADQNMCLGGNATFEVGDNMPDELDGTAPFIYQWQYYDGNAWNNVVNGMPDSAVYDNDDTYSLSISGNINIGSYFYRCYITNCMGIDTAYSESATLTVNGPPAQTISGLTPLCDGLSSIWSGTTPGGTWISSNPAVATIGAANGIVTGISAGTSLITYSVTNGSCTKTATKVIEITATIPQFITGSTPICVGSSAVWSSTTTGGLWSSSDPGIAAVDLSTGILAGVAPGSSVITYSVANGGCVNSATKQVTVTALVPQTITGATPLCAGSSALWTGTTTGGFWSSSASGVASINSSTGLITGVAQGTSVITYSVTTGGCLNTATKTLTITAPTVQTITGTTPLCTGSAEIWTSTTAGGTWLSSNTAIATVNAATGLITGHAAGISLITYSITTAGNCVNTATKTVTITSPVVQTISGTTPICEGSAALWTSTTPGGTWSGSAPGIATIDVSSGEVAGVAAGTSLISYSVTTSGGCVNNATKIVTITAPVAQTISGSTPICTGSIATWTSTTSGGTWSGNNSGVATVGASSGAITGISAGTAVVTYTVTTTGGCVNMASKVITVTAPVAQLITGTTPLCIGSSATWSGTTTGGIWSSSAPGVATISASSGLLTGLSAGSSIISYSVTTAGGCINTATKTVAVTAPIAQTISGTTPICIGSTVTWTATTGGGTWSSSLPGIADVHPVNGLLTGVAGGATVITYSVIIGGCVNTATKAVTITAPVAQIISGTNPLCSGSTATWTSTTTGGTWSSSLPAIAAIGSSAGIVSALTAGTSIITYAVTSGGCVNTATRTATVIALPVADAGSDTIYTGMPLLMGTPSSGPGSCSWSPVDGLDNPNTCQPSASPQSTTTYTLSVNNYGCIVTDQVTITYGRTINGVTCYAGKANAGSPIPAFPTYSPVKYTIDNVIVILRTLVGDELARDTSDTDGNFQFTNILNGTYKVSYDKYTPDTMIWGNDVNAIDVSLLKYFVGSDTNQDPSKCFSAKYKKAADVNNNSAINTIDIARIKSKIVSPYATAYNFPKGNWPVMDTIITLSGADINVRLFTVCYGDYNASSSKYRDSVVNWNGFKSMPEDIITESNEYIMTNDPDYFEVPLMINSKINNFSALGLELMYQDNEYKLETVSLAKSDDKKNSVKINPSFDEILADDNDLLVTDQHGNIRIVYATTDDFDLAAHDEIIRLGFRSLKKMIPGELKFTLSGTGVIGDKYGEENNDAYLLMPKIFVQGVDSDSEFEFAGYPNPFSGGATLKYTIPEYGIVKLNVYNAIGELVYELINESQQSGKHEVTFSANNLPTGLYTFKLEYTSMKESKCLVLKLVH